MAVRKDKTEATVKKTEAEVKIASPKKTTRKVFIPKDPGSRTENFIFVGVNGKNYQVKTGEEVEVPESVYNIIMQSFAASESANDYIESRLDPKNKGMEM